VPGPGHGCNQICAGRSSRFQRHLFRIGNLEARLSEISRLELKNNDKEACSAQFWLDRAQVDANHSVRGEHAGCRMY